MNKQATIYRMVMDKHLCPYGLKAKDLLQRSGFEVTDNHLTSREETNAFKEEHKVETTPQVFVGDQRIGGYDDLREYLGKDSDKGTSYQPVIAVFGVAAAMALAFAWQQFNSLPPEALILDFVAIATCILAILKLQNLEAFSIQFLNYDLLAQRWVRYGLVYPFAEAVMGIGMLGGFVAVAPIGLFIGIVGGISVFKAVYLDKRELKCACVGGNSKVPLGFISLSENLGMAAAGAWMIFRALQ